MADFGTFMAGFSIGLATGFTILILAKYFTERKCQNFEK